jgi:hypothetical protein
MKKIILLLILSISLSTFAQEVNKSYKNSIKFIPHKMIYNSLAIGYERDITSVSSLYFLSQIFYSEEDTDYNKGFAQSIGIKNYLLKGKEILHVSPSFYFMPYAQFGAFDTQEEDRYYEYEQTETYLDKREYLAYGGGFLMGFGLTFIKRITVDLYFGGGVMFNDYTPPSDYPDNLHRNNDGLWEGVTPKGGLEFSYKF